MLVHPFSYTAEKIMTSSHLPRMNFFFFLMEAARIKNKCARTSPQKLRVAKIDIHMLPNEKLNG